MKTLVVAVALAIAAAGGCATFVPPARIESEPAAIPVAVFAAGSARLALVLSGGAARGFAHIGVLKVLEEHGIKSDLIVGSSAGSIVGALYASGRSAGEVDAALSEMTMGVFADLVVPTLGFWPGELGIVKGERLRLFVRDRLLHERIEDFPIAFAAVATDLQSGSAHAFNRGDASLAVRASSAVPGILTPVAIRGRRYGDGQIASPLPARVARSLGARVVVAVDVIYPPRDTLLSSVPGVVFQAFTISMNRLKEYELQEADVVIRPAIPPTGSQLGLWARESLIEAGQQAAREALPGIKKAIAQQK